MPALNEVWVITALVFGAAMFGVQAVYWLFFRARKTNQTINRRLALSAQGNTASAVLEKLRSERKLTTVADPRLQAWSDFWTQTGLRFDSTTFVLASIALVIFYFLVFGMALDFGVIAFSLAVVFSLVSIYLFLARVRSRRIARFSEQLPDACDVIVRGVKVGYPISSAIALVAKEMPDPIGTEFGMTADEITFGLDVPAALENLYRRVGQEDLLFLVIAMSIQQHTGGKLSDLLSRLARTLRQRATLRLKVRALTAEGRLSGIFLSITPFILIAIISLLSPAYFTSVLNSPIIQPAIVLCLLLLVVGNITMYRMINFKF